MWWPLNLVNYICKTLTDLQTLMHNLSVKKTHSEGSNFLVILSNLVRICVLIPQECSDFSFKKHIVTDFRKPNWLICTKVSSINITHNPCWCFLVVKTCHVRHEVYFKGCTLIDFFNFLIFKICLSFTVLNVIFFLSINIRTSNC